MDKIGVGSYASVFQGVYKGVQVAVKKIFLNPNMKNQLLVTLKLPSDAILPSSKGIILERSRHYEENQTPKDCAIHWSCYF